MNGSETNKWKVAINKLDSLAQMKIWTLVPLSKKHITSQIVNGFFNKKYDENGHIDWYKVRLMARGFSQKYGIDY